MSSVRPDPHELVAEMRTRLIRDDVDDPLLSALEQYSGPMLQEMSDRLSMIESKAISVLGWSTALLAFMLLRPAGGQHSAAVSVLTGLAVPAAMVAVVAAALAVKSRKFEWPSVHHWFCGELFSTPLRLRALHIVELLASYNNHCDVAGIKAYWLVISQWALTAAALIVAVAAFLRVL